MFQQLHTIGRNTFIEAIRQPIFAVVTLAALIAMLFNPAITMYGFEEDNKLLIDIGMSTLLVAGLLVAAFTASGVISQEVENKTVLTVVSKPVGRPVFVVGKYLGIAAALILSYWILCIALFLTYRHGVMSDASKQFDLPVLTFGVLALAAAFGIAAMGNYFYHWVFTSSLMLSLGLFGTIAYILVLFLDNQFFLQSPATDFKLDILKGLFILSLALLIIAAVAVAASTRLGVIMTLITCILALILGLFPDYLMSTKAAHASGIGPSITRTIYFIVPNIQIFWPADAISQAEFGVKQVFSWKYIGLVTGLAAAFISAILSIAVALFQTREVG